MRDEAAKIQGGEEEREGETKRVGQARLLCKEDVAFFLARFRSLYFPFKSSLN